MKAILIPIIALSVVLCGCKTPSGPVSHAAFTAAVTLGEQFALESHPEATPFVRVGAQAVCAAAAGTNVSPAAIVQALNVAGVTNATAKLIINSSLALFNVVIVAAGTNQTEMRAYAQDLCTGMQAGLPPALANRDVAVRRARITSRVNAPHLLP